MLLIHGCPATHTLWQPLQERLSRMRTVVAVDLPGYGRSASPGTPDGFLLAHLARRLVALMRAVGFERFDLVAHSYGCAVAATMATIDPERIDRLVLITPMTHRVPPLARLARVTPLAALADVLWRIAPGAIRRFFINRGLRLNYGRQVPPSRAEQIALELDRPDTVRTIVRTMCAVGFEAYRATLLQLQRNPHPSVLLVGSGADRVVPAAHQRHLARLLERARLVFYEDGLHVVMWQKPEEVAREISAFLAERSSERTGE